MPFIFLGYSAFFFALFLFLGFGLTVLLTPDKIEKHALFLSPVIGYAYCTLAGWYFYSLSSRPADLYAPLILIPPALLLPFALLRLKKRRAFPTVFSRDLLPPLLIALAVYLLVTLPMLRYPGFTCLTLGNNDIAFNSLVARVIKEFPKSEYHRIDFFWPPSLVKDHIAFAPFGTYFISAFMSSVSGLEVYQVQMFLLYVFMAVSVLLTFPVARETFGYQPLGAGFVSLLVGLNGLTHYVVYHGFQHQAIAVPLVLALLLIVTRLVKTPAWKDSFFLILLFWALNVTYIHMLFISLGFLAIVLICLFFRSDSHRRAYQVFCLIVFSLTVMILLAPTRFDGSLHFLVWLMKATSTEAGWFINLPSFTKIVGVTPFPKELCLRHYLFGAHLKLQDFSAFLMGWVTFLLIIEGLFRFLKKDRPAFLRNAFCLFGIGLTALVLAFQGRTDQGWGGYKAFKLLSFFLPVLLAASLGFLRDMTLRFRDRREELLGLFMLALLLFNLNTATKTVQRMIWLTRPILADTVALSKLRGLPARDSINIPQESTWWNILWETYFLAPRKLYFEQGTYFMPSRSLDGEWWLVRKSGGETTPDLTRENWGPVFYLNPTYSLAKIRG